MLKQVPCLACIFFFVTTVFCLNHLVVLKATESLESFMKYDVTFPVAQRVKNFITKDFKIGNLVGFTGNFTKAALDRLKRCPMVEEILPDVVFKAFDIEEQQNAPTHLARLSQASGFLKPKRSYFYEGNARGSDVNVYIIDSGIQIKHPEFQSRALAGMDFTDEGSGDTNGHGTHVAGIIGSKTYGVAKDATLIELKTLDKFGQGSLSSILSAIEYAVNHRKDSMRPGVANLSLGANTNSLLNRVIDSASETGLVLVVAAGNLNIDACLTSPASAAGAITVGAIDDSTLGVAEFSNWGLCVDVFASGVGIASVNANDAKKPNTLSGTSMAAPVVSGLIANFMSDGVSPFEVKQHLLDLAVKNEIVTGSLRRRPNTPNLLAYNGCDPAEATDLDGQSSGDE